MEKSTTVFRDHTHSRATKSINLADNTVSAADLNANVEMARLIFQCDVARRHFECTVQLRTEDEDYALFLFQIPHGATGQTKGCSAQLQSDYRCVCTRLTTPWLTHRTYYFMALAYGYNDVRRHTTAGAGTGQDLPVQGFS